MLAWPSHRSIDSRSDLYALGVTFYQMLTGGLPFTAADPMEWVHCHIARQPVPPCERLQDVPGSVSAIIMKLLAKTAEERYQTCRSAPPMVGGAATAAIQVADRCRVQQGEGRETYRTRAPPRRVHSAAKGCSSKPLAGTDPRVLRSMSMRARNATGTCRWPG